MPWRTLSAAIAGVLLLFLTAGATAATYYAKFSNTQLDPNLSVTADPGFSYSIHDGAYYVAKAQGIGNGWTTLLTRFDVQGDFVATVRGSRQDLASNGELCFGMFKYPPFSTVFSDIYFVGGSAVYSNIFMPPIHLSRTALNAAGTVGFRLRRVGNSLVTEYDPGSGFVLLAQASNPGVAIPVRINLFLIQEHGNTAAHLGSFDDLEITAAGFSNVLCCSRSTILLPRAVLAVGESVTPTAMIRNCSSFLDSVVVRFLAPGYPSPSTSLAMSPGDSVSIAFPSWAPSSVGAVDTKFVLEWRGQSCADTLHRRITVVDPVPILPAGECFPGSTVVQSQSKIFPAPQSAVVVTGAAYWGDEIDNIGDINRDGITDMAAYAVFDRVNGQPKGSVHLLFMNSAGGVDSTRKITQGLAGFPDTLTNQGRFGDGLAPLGDLDRDGVNDIAIGNSVYQDIGGHNPGAVWICFMNQNGTIKSVRKITLGTGGFGGALDHMDMFGSSLAYMGRCCGDSLVALAVGAPGDDDGIGYSNMPGAIYILRIRPDGSVASWNKISQTSGNLGPVLNDHEMFGQSLASLRDLDHDGHPDLAVGALGNNGDIYEPGSVWILFLDASWNVARQVKISEGLAGFSGPLDGNDYFGSSLAGLGEIHGDGTYELAVGAPNDDDGGENKGAVYILSLRQDGTVLCRTKISSTTGGFAGALNPWDGFGVGCAADSVDLGSGTVRLLVGAPLDDSGSINQGAV